MLALIFAASLQACAHPTAWWRGATIYEVFVRSFADSDGDGIGDLSGLTGRLDYLQKLGAGGLWLMPIHPSPSYHGYDVVDYRAVNPDYGTLDSFDDLIREAHARGLRVILDLVLNHSSSLHPWFTDPARRDWYLWRREPLPWQRPWDGAPVWHRASNPSEGYYYGLFWSGMPDLNLANPAVEAEMAEVMRFWLARGVDGFRVDAARHLIEGENGELSDTPASHALIRRLRASVARDYPETLWVAEAWISLETAAEYFGHGDEYQLAFSFDLAGAITTAVSDGQRVELASVLRRSEAAIADRSFEAPFLSNHDQPRVMRALHGDRARARLAAAILFALPGTPFVYYGEELGMQGGPEQRDEDKRTPMRWGPEAPAASWYGPSSEPAGVDVASEEADPASLLALYRRLIALRNATPSLRYASARVTAPPEARGVLAIQRGPVLFVANLGGEASPPFSLPAGSGARVLLQEGLAGPPTWQSGQVAIGALGPRAFAFIALE